MTHDWSYKPDIHDNEPVVEVGLRYTYNKKKLGRKVHEINPVTGKSFCKLENGIRSKLVQSVDCPPDRQLCSVCQNMKRSNIDDINSVTKVGRKEASGFYSSHEWAELRYKAFVQYGRECVVCGSTKNLTVDHIKPLRKHPELARDISNLQVMCRLCNRGKGGWDETDWRSQ